MAEHGVPAVRCAALHCLGHTLRCVRGLPPSDAQIFNECALDIWTGCQLHERMQLCIS